LSWGTLDFTQLVSVLRFIKTQTRGKVMQAPQITALNHEEATIHVGKLVRYAEQFVETTELGGKVSGFREAKNSPVKLGIQILVIPHVTGPENNVLLTIIPKAESPAGAELFETFSGGGGMELKLPQTSQRIVVTKMMLRDGETGVIAGLREEWEGETITKVPILGDIPIIQWLFMSRERPRETNKSSNLLMFITPKVIDFSRTGDLEAVMELSRSQLAEAFAIYEAEAP
jgi:general secretion pathway protein D